MGHDITNRPTATGEAKTTTRLATFTHALLFVLGFSLVFVVGWGGAATLLGQLFSQYKTLLSQVGGVIVILFGLHTIGLLKLRWLDTVPVPPGKVITGGGISHQA